MSHHNSSCDREALLRYEINFLTAALDNLKKEKLAQNNPIDQNISSGSFHLCFIGLFTANVCILNMSTLTLETTSLLINQDYFGNHDLLNVDDKIYICGQNHN